LQLTMIAPRRRHIEQSQRAERARSTFAVKVTAPQWQEP